MKDNTTSPEQIFNKPIRRTTFLGPIVGKLPKSGGGSGGPTTYTKSVVNNITNHELTITNVVDGSQQTPYTINYGSGSGPTEYLKTASVNGNTLTLFKQDDTTIAFTPSATTDYNNLTNKPSINNITLSGNKTAADLSLVSTTEYTTDLARISGYITTLQGNVETISSAYLTNASVNQAGDTLTITKQDGSTVVFTLSGSGELPIKYEETYDSSKIISGYLTAFANLPNGLYFKLANSTIKCLATIDYRFDGEITNVGVNGNTLTFVRSNQPNLVYEPTVVAEIITYNYTDTSTHVISGRAESNWWLIIPKSSFGSSQNIVNIRSVKATATSTAGAVDLSASVMVSVWKLVDATSLPEAQAIDPNAAIGDLMILLDVRNTSNAQVTVNNVEFIIQTTLGGGEGTSYNFIAPLIEDSSHNVSLNIETPLYYDSWDDKLKISYKSGDFRLESGELTASPLKETIAQDISTAVNTLSNTCVKTTGDQTISGTKTFSDNIVGNLTGKVNGVKLVGYAVVRLNSIFGTVEVVSTTGNIQVMGYGTTDPTIFIINGFGTIEASYRLISVQCFDSSKHVTLATVFDSTYQQFAVPSDTYDYYNIMIWSHKQ